MRSGRAAIVVIAALVCAALPARGIGPETDSRDAAWSLIWRAFEGEKLPATGTLRFRIQVDGESSALMTSESKQLNYVDFSWAPGKKFRIVMMGKSGPIRTVVSDGKAIHTGLHVWDARFAWGYEPHSRDINSDLRLQLDDEMWVYSSLLTKHLHPLSGFENTFTADMFGRIYEMSIPKETAAKPSDITLVKLRLGSEGRYHENLQIQTVGDFVFAKSNRPPGNLEQGLAYVRNDPVDVAGLGRVVRACVVEAETSKDIPVSPFRWTSELIPDAPIRPPADADFAVKDADSDLILWPYGSRMNNLWYGIVDTIQDWWEGVSDGVIGD